MSELEMMQTIEDRAAEIIDAVKGGESWQIGAFRLYMKNGALTAHVNRRGDAGLSEAEALHLCRYAIGSGQCVMKCN